MEVADDWFIQVTNYIYAAGQNRIAARERPDCRPGLTRVADQLAANANQLMNERCAVCIGPDTARRGVGLDQRGGGARDPRPDL